MLRFGLRNMLSSFVACTGLVCASGALAQAAFDFDRYDVLDRRVAASDEAMNLEEVGTPAWESAARFSAAARTDLFYYIDATIADATLDAETRDALEQMRATTAIDLTGLMALLGACEEADRWLAAATTAAHPLVADALDAARVVAAGCVSPMRPVVAGSEPPVATEHEPPSEPGPRPVPGETTAATPTSPAHGGPATPAPNRSLRTGRAMLGTGAALGGVAIALDFAGVGDRRTIRDLQCGDAYCVDAGDRRSYADADRRENRRLIPIVVLAGTGIGASVAGGVCLARGLHQDDAHPLSFVWTGSGVSARLRW